MTSLYDNRRGVILPEKPNDISIGNEQYPLKALYALDGNFYGQVNSQEIKVGGKLFTKDDLTYTPPKFNKENVLEHVNTSNMTVQNNIEFSGTIEGDGSMLDLTAVRSSVAPGVPELQLGYSNNPFVKGFIQKAEMNECTIKNTCKAGEFVGDGYGLCNVTPYLLDVKSPIYNDGQGKYDIGTTDKPFGDTFCDSLSSKQYIKGRRLLITNANYPFNIEKKALIQSPKVVSDGIITEELRDKLGDDLDLQVNTSVVGINYTVDLNCKELTVQRNVDFASNVRMGSLEKPLQDLYCYNGHFLRSYSNEGDLSVSGNFTAGGTTDLKGDLFCEGNIHGNGKFIDAIDHLDPQISNVIPKFDDALVLGTSDLRWKSLQVNDVHADHIECTTMDVKSNITIDGRTVKYNDWGILKPQDREYNANSSFRFTLPVNDTTFLTDVQGDDGRIGFSKTGVYSINMFAISTNYSALDNDFNWSMDHYHYDVGRTVTHGMTGFQGGVFYLKENDWIHFTIHTNNLKKRYIHVREEGGIMVTALTYTST